LFSKILGRYGSGADYFEGSLGSAMEVTQSTLKTVLAAHDLPSIRSIQPDFRRGTAAFNAKSGRRRARGAYRVELTAGLVLILREVFERASCLDIGLQITDDPPLPQPAVAFPATVGLRPSYLTRDETDFSKPSWWQQMTPARIRRAHYMCLLGIWFVVNHEIAHIIRGHFIYLKQHGFTGALSELSFVDRRSPHFKHRFLEYDADTFAFDLMVWQIEREFGRLRKSNAKAVAAVFHTYLAAMLIFLLLDRNTPALAFEDSRTHPPLLARGAHLTQTLFDLFRDTQISLETVGAEVNRVLWSCCHVAAHLGIPNGRWLPGRMLGKEFALSLEDRDAYLGIVARLSEVADLKSVAPVFGD
jgi:hypothetical protein